MPSRHEHTSSTLFVPRLRPARDARTTSSESSPGVPPRVDCIKRYAHALIPSTKATELRDDQGPGDAHPLRQISTFNLSGTLRLLLPREEKEGYLTSLSR